MEIRLTAAQWTAWQDPTTGTLYRQAFLSGAAAAIAGDIGAVTILQPNGTTIASYAKQCTWTQV